METSKVIQVPTTSTSKPFFIISSLPTQTLTMASTISLRVNFPIELAQLGSVEEIPSQMIVVVASTTQFRFSYTNAKIKQTDAMGYRDGCMLRYSDQSIFGSYQKPEFYLPYYNEDNATDTNFNGTVNDLLQNLTKKAAAGDSHRKFAESASDGAFLEPIYGLVQCTLDLSERSYEECLQKAILEINGRCCVNKIGASIDKLSCSVRYEKYRFYDRSVIDSLQPSLPPSAPNSTVNTTSSTGISST